MRLFRLKIWALFDMGGFPRYYLFYWDFPWNKPSRYWDTPMAVETRHRKFRKFCRKRSELVWTALPGLWWRWTPTKNMDSTIRNGDWTIWTMLNMSIYAKKWIWPSRICCFTIKHGDFTINTWLFDVVLPSKMVTFVITSRQNKGFNYQKWGLIVDLDD